jgi:flagellar biosynthesis regulator FlbT
MRAVESIVKITNTEKFTKRLSEKEKAAVEKAMEELAYEAIKEIRQQMIKEKAVASGQTYTNYQIIKQPTRFAGVYSITIGSTTTNMRGKPYARYGIEIGRGAGKRPPVEAIKKWIEDKNIRPKDSSVSARSLPFVISRAIGEEGTKGNAHHVVRKALNNLRRRKRAQKILYRTMQSEFRKGYK